MLVTCKIITFDEAKKRIAENLPTYACIDSGEIFFYLNANDKPLFKAYTSRFNSELKENDKALFFTNEITFSEAKIDFLEPGQYFCDEFYEDPDPEYGHPAIKQIKSAKEIYKNWGHTQEEYEKFFY